MLAQVRKLVANIAKKAREPIWPERPKNLKKTKIPENLIKRRKPKKTNEKTKIHRNRKRLEIFKKKCIRTVKNKNTMK